MRILAAILTSLMAVALYGASATVGCPGGTPGDYATITDAVNALGYDNGPHSITVSGTCTESVLLRGRERLTIQGPATVIGAGGPAFSIRGGHNLTLRDLVVRGSGSAVQIGEKADVAFFGVTAENVTNGFAVDAFGGASLVLGGTLATDGVTLRNSAGGMRCEACSAFFAGWVTIENNTGNTALLIDSGRVEGSGQRPASPSGPVQGGPIAIRNNAFNGVSVTSRGYFELARLNYIENNGSTGIILTDGSASLLGSFTPDGTPMGTIVQGNPRNGVAVLFNSTFRSSGPNTYQNNGSPSDLFRAAISATHSSMVNLTGGTITANTGPGISADALASVRLNGATISGNSEGGVRLSHGSALESVAGNTISDPSVICDGTSMAFGDFTGVAVFECDKATKK